MWQGVFRRIYEVLLEDKVITPDQVRRCSCHPQPWPVHLEHCAPLYGLFPLGM